MNLSSFEESAEAQLIHKEISPEILKRTFEEFENRLFSALNVKLKGVFIPENTEQLKVFVVRFLHNQNLTSRGIFIKVFEIQASNTMPLYQFLNRTINKFHNDFFFERKQYDRFLNEVF